MSAPSVAEAAPKGGLRLVPRTTVGAKFVVAVTGLGLLAFVIAHMLGNLQIFLGPDALNAYAQFYKDHAALLWTARLVLLAFLIVHMALAIQLALRNAAARPTRYVYQHTEYASLASRTMVVTGLAVFFFIVYHLLHFTVGVTNPDDFALRDSLGRHDVYGMVIAGFRNPFITGAYVLAQLFLFMHLSHAVPSTFATFGLNRPRWDRGLRRAGLAVAYGIAIGNIAIPLSVLFGLVK
jgi:succinate dehydrogenase / fumarate reductase cytochrome b subunit